jgi:hypothetical protein
MNRRKIGGVVLAGALLAVVLAVTAVALLYAAYLGGDQMPEENDICIGGGHLGYALALVLVAAPAFLAATASVVMAVRGHRRAWLPALLSIALVGALVVLVLSGTPNRGA